MESPQFDPGGFYEFNMRGGAVKTRDGQRVLVVGHEVLAPLVAAAAATGDLTPLRSFGQALAKEAQSSLGSAAAEAEPEAVVGHASSVMALFGWGRLELERWGQALVFTMTDLPALDERQLAAAALLGGFASGLSGREVACVPVADQRFLIVDPTIADTVWKLARGGMKLPELVAKLHGGAQ